MIDTALMSHPVVGSGTTPGWTGSTTPKTSDTPQAAEKKKQPQKSDNYVLLLNISLFGAHAVDSPLTD